MQIKQARVRNDGEQACGRDKQTIPRLRIPVCKSAPPPAARTILIIEDDLITRQALETIFNEEGFQTIAVADGVELAARAQYGPVVPDIIIADYILPGGRTGLEIIIDLRCDLGRDIPAIVISGIKDTRIQAKILAARCEYLIKPVSLAALNRCVENLTALPAPE